MGNTAEKKINDLMLWNDSNLKFVLEPGGYAYLKKVRKFIMEYLCRNILLPKISKSLLLANSDFEHKNDIFDLLLNRISENMNADK